MNNPDQSLKYFQRRMELAEIIMHEIPAPIIKTRKDFPKAIEHANMITEMVSIILKAEIEIEK